ncbi:lymphocyte activation gene 3 protein [Halichoeres trimaculatus]|uniref:lymphocyte activation gene 3 protein n=1 Tax=Halichoeres trimaculatus TaxID=147232 RepID=UPI003D9ED95D
MKKRERQDSEWKPEKKFKQRECIFVSTGAQCKVTEVFAEEGSVAVLPCKCNPSSTFPRAIVWSKDNQGTVWRKQKSGLQYWGSSWTQGGVPRVRCPHFNFERGDYSLQITNVREEDGGIYSCRIENANQVTNMVRLRIIKVSISPPAAIGGENVSISCNVTPWPYGADVQWTLNKSLFVPRSESITNREVANRVVRTEATSEVTGNWTCVVTYQGKKGQASATLTMKGINKPFKDNTKLYSAAGSAVSLPCVFSPGPTPTSPVWEKLKPESLFNPVPGPLPASFSPPSPSSQNPWDLSASLKEVRFEDAGKYRCSATAGRQRFTRNMQLVVAQIESSSTPKTKHSVTLTCKVTDTSDITDYEWVHVAYDYNNTPSVESRQKGNTLTINTASDENQGEWVCRFYRKEDMLGNVTYHALQMSALTGKKSSSPTQNTAVIVGLSILLLVLLLVLAQMYKNHQRRRRILQYPALETIIHTASNEREERERNQVQK